MSWVSRIERTKGMMADTPAASDESYKNAGVVRLDKKYEAIRVNVHKEIITEYNNKFASGSTTNDAASDVMELIHQSLANQEQHLTRLEESRLAQEILDDVIGLGPIEPLLRDKSISEVMVNHAKQVYIERFGTTDALGKIDISWDNKRILAGYERLSFSDYGGHWLTFSYRSLPSLSKEVLATREDVIQQNISTCYYNYTEIAQGRRAGCFLSPNEKYIAIDSKSVTGATDHPVTIINRETGAEVDSFALENYRPSEVFIIGWTADNSLVMGLENTIFKVSEAKNWAIEELTRLPFNFFHI